jgi:hypothetical protein
MELTMGLFLYYVFSIILIVMLIRVVAKERVWSTLKFYFFHPDSFVFRNSYEPLKLWCICCISGAMACGYFLVP